MNFESAPKSPEYAGVTFKPGGPLEHLGGLSAQFGDVRMDIISSTNNLDVCWITGLEGRNTEPVLKDIARAIKQAGFTSVDYRPDNSDGRASARVRLFESFKNKLSKELEL